MKAAFILSLIFLFFYFPAKTQLSFGIKGSSIQAKQVFYNHHSSTMQGLGTSLTLYKKLNNFIEVGIEPGITQRGNGSEYLGVNFIMGDFLFPGLSPFSSFIPTVNSVQGFKTTYAQLPLKVRLKTPLVKNKFALMASLGGGPSWLVNGYFEAEEFEENTFQYIPTLKALDFSESDDIKRFEWGVYSSIGLAYQLGFGHLSFETDFYNGLTKMFTHTDVTNRSVGYSLGLAVNI